MVHLKRNYVLMLSWAFLFAVVLEAFGQIVGVPYLFLDPEYLGRVSYKSMALVGLAFGLFSMAFHLTGYALDGERFRFLAGFKYPFLIYYLNNGVLPTLFITVYAYSFITFQAEAGGHTPLMSSALMTVFLLAVGVVHTAAHMVFRLGQRSKLARAGLRMDEQFGRSRLYRITVLRQARTLQRSGYQISHFLNRKLRWRKADPVHLEAPEVWPAFRRMHLLAVGLEIFLVILLLFLGYVMAGQQDRIPAAASGILFLTLVVLVLGAIGYWLQGWMTLMVIVAVFAINHLYTRGYIKNDYQAAGMHYDAGLVDDSLPLQNQFLPDTLQSDLLHMEGVLRKRLEVGGERFEYNEARFAEADSSSHLASRIPYPVSKPRAVFICFSGGGQRAALWALRCLQRVDSATGGALYQNTILMTGASGGMLGAALYREARHRKMPARLMDTLYWKLGQDLLNPIIFTYLNHDLPLRYRTYRYGARTYSYDRGRAFDQQFHLNTGGILQKSLSDNAVAEREGQIPLLLLSPMVADDGRKLLISPQPISFMAAPAAGLWGRQEAAGIEFRRKFARQGADSIDFMAALRMNATFPYILPNVTLPSKPPMRIMDAGLADNFGIQNASRFIQAMAPWLEQNTSGLLILSIRDSPKSGFTRTGDRQTLFDQAFNPIGSLYANWSYLQDTQNDQYLQMLAKSLSIPIDYQTIEYGIGGNDLAGYNLIGRARYQQKRASLSWHLTEFEKANIYRTVNAPRNTKVLQRLHTLFADTSVARGIHGK